MKTVPHVVEEKHLRLFHPVGQSVIAKRSPVSTTSKGRKARRPSRRAPVRKAVRKAPAKKRRTGRKAPARKAVKKTIKGRATRRSHQSSIGPQRSNFKDIFSR